MPGKSGEGVRSSSANFARDERRTDERRSETAPVETEGIDGAGAEDCFWLDKEDVALMREERERNVDTESEAMVDRLLRGRSGGRLVEIEGKSSWGTVEISATSTVEAIDDVRGLTGLDVMLRRAACVANAVLVELLLDLLGDAEVREAIFFTLVAAPLGSKLILFRCGSLAGDNTFLGIVAFVNEARFGVPPFNDTLRVGVAEIVELA